MFWAFLALTVIFLILMIKNSVGNVVEVITLLDKDVYTGQQIEEHYAYLIGKYGEWQIVGNSGSMFEISFVNIGNAFFSGLMVTYMTLTIISFIVMVVGGKVVLPKLAQHYADNNQDMANLATLRTHEEIMKKNKKSNEGEWF